MGWRGWGSGWTDREQREAVAEVCPQRRLPLGLGRDDQRFLDGALRLKAQKAARSATVEAAGSSTRGGGWAPSGPDSFPGSAEHAKLLGCAQRGRRGHRSQVTRGPLWPEVSGGKGPLWPEVSGAEGPTLAGGYGCGGAHFGCAAARRAARARPGPHRSRCRVAAGARARCCRPCSARAA